jgi:anti-anti-sigma factor
MGLARVIVGKEPPVHPERATMEITTDGATLVLSGAFDVRSTMEVRNALYELLAQHDGDVVVDLSGVDTVDMTALKVLAVATRQAGRDGHRLTLRGCRPAVRRMLHMTRLIRVLEVERAAATA